MAGFDGGDGRFAGFDAIEKIPNVARRFVELDFAQLVGESFILRKLLLGAVHSPIVRGDPAVRANPFRAFFDVGNWCIAASLPRGPPRRPPQLKAIFLKIS